jgi:hypothetical protein
MIGSFLIKNEKESSDMKEVIFQFAQKASIGYNKRILGKLRTIQIRKTSGHD